MEEQLGDSGGGGGEMDKENDHSQSLEPSQPTQAEELLPKRGATSVVWTWFGYKTSDTEQTTVLCKVCRRKVTTTDSNTSNLFYHLRKNHDKEYEESQRLKGVKSSNSGESVSTVTPKKAVTQTLEESFARVTPYTHSSRRWKEMTNTIAEMICIDMVPISTVEKRGFKRVMRKADPRYEMPGRNKMNKVIKEIYDDNVAKVEAEIHRGMYYATTTDMWSSRTTDSYMSLTIHFIDDQAWNLRSRCLQTIHFQDDHTGVNIASGLSDSLEAWGLDEERLVCVTTDNASNNVLALQINDWPRLQCFGHRLHLAVEHSLKLRQVERAVSVCKKIVAAFGNSGKRKKQLEKAQAAQNPPLPAHQLISECPTRWGSMQAMIERMIEQEKAVSHVLRANKKTRHLVPTWQDMDVLESMNQALSPIKDFTDALSGEDYVTVSFLKPTLHLFNTQIVKSNDSDTELTKTIKEGILKYLNEKYDDPTTDDLLNMACLVDPRFKTTYIQKEREEYVKTRAAAELQKLALAAEQQAVPGPSAVPAAARGQDEPEVVVVPAKKQKRSLSSYFKTSAKPTQAAAPQSSREYADKELNSYLLSYVDEDTEPLEWWKQHEKCFPLVAKLARKYLCIPATSSPSERAFSTGGNIVTCQRASLKPSRVNQLVFLALNL